MSEDFTVELTVFKPAFAPELDELTELIEDDLGEVTTTGDGLIQRLTVKVPRRGNVGPLRHAINVLADLEHRFDLDGSEIRLTVTEGY